MVVAKQLHGRLTLWAFLRWLVAQQTNACENRNECLENKAKSKDCKVEGVKRTAAPSFSSSKVVAKYRATPMNWQRTYLSHRDSPLHFSIGAVP